MASDSNQIMLQTKQTPVRSNTHQILKAVNKGNQTSQLVKCVTTTASSIQPQQKIIMMNGINNNQTTVIRKGINDRNDSNQSQNTVIHSRPTMTTSIANGQAIDVSYLRQNVIQNPIQMKGGQRTVIGQMPMQTINANPPIVYYPTNFGQGTFHATSGQLQTATSQQIRDAVNNNQSNISHHHNLQKALPNGCQFVQLIPNTAMISQASAMNNAQHTTQLITTQAPMNSDVVTLQKTERPAILKRQRPQVNTTERRATFGNNHVSCPKIPKVDVEPVHIKVATGASQVTPSSLPVAMMPSSSTPSTDHSAGTAIGTSAPISSNKRNISNSTSVTPNSNSGFAITSTNVPKLNELSSSNDGSAAKLEKSVLSTGTINNPSLIRQQTVIRSPRKPRKQTLIRTEQTNAGQSRLSDPIIGQKKLMDEVSTDEADEFEDENPASENRAENRLKLEIHRDTGSTRQYKFPTKRSNNRGNNQIILSPGTPSLSEKLSNPFGPNNSEKVIMSSTSLTPIMSPKLDSGNHNKSCVRLRIFGGQNAQSSSKKERDNLRHFAKHSDVKMAAVENLTLTQLRFLTKSTSSKVDAVNQAIRHMQKDESSIYSILEDLKSKERGKTRLNLRYRYMNIAFSLCRLFSPRLLVYPLIRWNMTISYTS